MIDNERIKELRKFDGLSQGKFAEKCGLKRDLINNIENNKQVVQVPILRKIAEAYPEFRNWIMTGDEYPESGLISPMTKKTSKDMKVGS
ncbi:MAG: hypothetical protein ISEC1_P2072 [Thiomicrorhabdus sp.]|nr:MAG: hypothetical protein ISEC1_P2072 [Thiomicrorhabdus sp.]